MTDEQIKHMVARFLMWKLPENFNPDNGINFDCIANPGTEYQHHREPVGTNLLDANQAEVMIRYMLEDLPNEVRMQQSEPVVCQKVDGGVVGQFEI